MAPEKLSLKNPLLDGFNATYCVAVTDKMPQFRMVFTAMKLRKALIITA